MTKIKYVLPILVAVIGLVVFVSFKNGNKNETKQKATQSAETVAKAAQACYYFKVQGSAQNDCSDIASLKLLHPIYTNIATKPPTSPESSWTCNTGSFCCAVSFPLDQIEQITLATIPVTYQWKPKSNATPCPDPVYRSTAPTP